MNLIANESELDLEQEKAIYELTLKKQRSKKSTISQKQMAAMQQLASELITQRKEFHHLIDHNQNQIDDHPHTNRQQTIRSNDQTNNSNNNTTQTSEQNSIKKPTNQRHNQLCRCTKSTTSSSFISTASTTSSSSIMSDEINIKLSQLRLEQLNNELERRLHQYEYLVAQEKAILSAYKMNLFTNEGVNNFHLFHLNQKSPLYK